MSFFVFKREKIRCPFCHAPVVSAYHQIEEVDAIPPKIPKNRIIAANKDDLDTSYNYCPHVAFFCYWGYTEPEITEAYRPLFLEIGEKLEINESILEGEIAVYFTDSNEEILETAIKEAYPSIRVQMENVCLSSASMPQWNLPGIIQIIFIKYPSLE